MVEQPGFMRTEMTKGVGFDKFWDDGGGMEPTVAQPLSYTMFDLAIIAVTPDEAARSLVEFIARFGLKMTGEYWAPRGPRSADLMTLRVCLTI